MTIPRYQVVPLPDHQVRFSIGGRERFRWHFGPQYPRPFFYPLASPGRDVSLTRMGHPGAPNHDHHRSVWFAHHKVLGIDFWGDNTDARIRQQQWLAYQDGDKECAMAVKLGWFDGHDPQPLMEQELIVFLRQTWRGGDSLTQHDYALETQSTFTPRSESLELQQTNFGFFAVRVAASISAYFGGGQLTGSDRAVNEPNLFGKPNRWMDYSGPVVKPSTQPPAVGVHPDYLFDTAGITYFDHPDNVSYPSKWHVREDGWMGASVCRDRPVVITKEDPLRLRYLLHVHNGEVDPDAADRLADEFAEASAARLIKSTKKHTHYEIERI
jgi:hypothetical protein